MISTEERFWSQVDRRGPDECWPWIGTKTRNGYGRFRDMRALQAHRFVYEMEVGPIPEGLVIDHLCRNRGCVNPAHMEPVTNRENILRGESHVARQAAQTHCKRGHEFTPENIYRYRSERRCRACELVRKTEWNRTHPRRPRKLTGDES